MKWNNLVYRSLKVNQKSISRNLSTFKYTNNSSSSFNHRVNTFNNNNLIFSRKENNTSSQNIKKRGRKFSRIINRREKSLLSSSMKKFLNLMINFFKASPLKNYVQTNNFLLLMKMKRKIRKRKKSYKSLYL